MKTKLETPELKSGSNSKEFFTYDFNKKRCATTIQEINAGLKPLRIVRKPNLFLIISFLTILLFTNGCAVMCDMADILLETTPPPITQVVIVTPSHHFSSYNHAPHYRSSNHQQMRSNR
jgi:hypothetical protein